MMGAALRYWRLVTIGVDGTSRVRETPALKAFWQQQFPEFAHMADVPDLPIQRQLFQQFQVDSALQDSRVSMAELCLRCFISNQIEQTCLQLEKQFGQSYGVQAVDLFPFVLTDMIPLTAARNPNFSPSLYRSLGTQILQSFDPTQSNLSTWTTWLVRSHPELRAFLLEHGVYLISDWALLNDTTPAQVQRILSEFHGLTDLEINQATHLLKGFHAVYQRDRLQQCQAGIRGQCADPTVDQLTQIAQQVSSTRHSLTAEQVQSDLRTLAQRLRQYRVAVRGKKLPTQSIDDPDRAIGEISTPASEEEDATTEFLEAYRQDLRNCLDQAIAQVIDDRLIDHQRKQPPTDRQFLVALCLFHCQGKSMSEIATHIGLQEQYKVSRLLKLRALRADVRQIWLLTLRDRVRELAQTYVDSTRLQQVEQQLDTALDEQVDHLIEEAAAEASVGNRSLNSLFFRRLCSDLDRRGMPE